MTAGMTETQPARQYVPDWLLSRKPKELRGKEDGDSGQRVATAPREADEKGRKTKESTQCSVGIKKMNVVVGNSSKTALPKVENCPFTQSTANQKGLITGSSTNSQQTKLEQHGWSGLCGNRRHCPIESSGLS